MADFVPFVRDHEVAEGEGYFFHSADEKFSFFYMYDSEVIFVDLNSLSAFALEAIQKYQMLSVVLEEIHDLMFSSVDVPF